MGFDTKFIYVKTDTADTGKTVHHGIGGGLHFKRVFIFWLVYSTSAQHISLNLPDTIKTSTHNQAGTGFHISYLITFSQPQ